MVWEDNGLWFTLFLNTIAVVIMYPVSRYLYNHDSKTLTRVLRPNRQAKLEKQTIDDGNPKNREGAAIFQLSELSGKIGWLDMETSNGDVPLSPNVAMFVFFLKNGAVLFVLGTLATLWLILVYGTDTYMVDFATANDPRECKNAGTHGDCTEDVYCKWRVNSSHVNGGECKPAPKAGLVDLSFQNLTPKGFRVYLAALFSIGFAIAVVILTRNFATQMYLYAKKMIPLQNKYCRGSRVVLVRGLSASEKKETKKECKAREEELKPLITDEEFIEHAKGLIGLEEYPNQDHLMDICTVRAAPKDYDKKKALVEELEEALMNAVAEERVAEPNKKTGEKEPIMKKVPKGMPPKLIEVRVTEHVEEQLREAVEDYNKALAEVPMQDLLNSLCIEFPDRQKAMQFIQHMEEKGGACSPLEFAIAGHPEDVHWANLANNKYAGWVKFFFIVIVFIILVFFWSIPVAFLGSLDSLSGMPAIGPPFKYFVKYVPATIRGILQAYLPVIVLAVFNIVLPPMIRAFAIAGGAVIENQVQRSVVLMLYVFMVMCGVVLQAALQGGLSQLGGLIRNPTKEAVFALIVAICSPSGGYFFAKVLTAGVLGRWIFALQLGPVITSKILAPRAITQKAYDAFFAIRTPTFKVHVFYAQTLVVFSMGVFFHVTVPLLSFFVAVYFVSSYVVFRGVLFDQFRDTKKNPERDQLTDFSFPVQWMRIIIVLYTISSCATILICTMKEAFYAYFLTWFGVAAAIYCHVHLYINAKKIYQLELEEHGEADPTGGEDGKEEATKPCKLEDEFRPKHQNQEALDADALVQKARDLGQAEVIQWATDKVGEEEEQKEDSKLEAV